MWLLGIIVGFLTCLIGIAFTVLVLIVGVSPGFGMSEGTRGEFVGGLATGFAVTGFGVLLAWFSRRKKKPKPQ